MKKIRLINIIIISLILITLFGFSTASYATVSLDSMKSQADSWIEEGKTDAQSVGTIDTEQLSSASKVIYNTFLVIAFVLAAIIGSILGIQIMAGSIERKTEAKQALVPYVISCVIVFGSFGIWKVLVMILGQV